MEVVGVLDQWGCVDVAIDLLCKDGCDGESVLYVFVGRLVRVYW